MQTQYTVKKAYKNFILDKSAAEALQ